MEPLLTIEAAQRLESAAVVGSGQVDGHGYDVVVDYTTGGRSVVGSAEALEAMSLVYDAVENLSWGGE